VHVTVDKGFAAELIVHIHPDDSKPLRHTSFGEVAGNTIVIKSGLLAAGPSLEIDVT
jgi:hypothetical protein